MLTAEAAEPAYQASALLRAAVRAGGPGGGCATCGYVIPPPFGEAAFAEGVFGERAFGEGAFGEGAFGEGE
ncbi:MAG TPA: hypothetical protein VIY54_08105 [Steroidobacteraceae bacterium]